MLNKQEIKPTSSSFLAVASCVWTTYVALVAYSDFLIMKDLKSCAGTMEEEKAFVGWLMFVVSSNAAYLVCGAVVTRGTYLYHHDANEYVEWRTTFVQRVNLFLPTVAGIAMGLSICLLAWRILL